jgi:hypothetical protein
VYRRRASPRDVHEFGADLVVVAVGADAQVERIAQAERRELDLGHRPDVPGEHGLVHPVGEPRQSLGTDRRQRLRRARQRLPAGHHGLADQRRLRAELRDERVYVAPWLWHAGQ